MELPMKLPEQGQAMEKRNYKVQEAPNQILILVDSPSRGSSERTRLASSLPSVTFFSFFAPLLLIFLMACGQNSPTPTNVSPPLNGLPGAVPSQQLCAATPGTILTQEGCLPQLSCPIQNGIRSAYSQTQQRCIPEVSGVAPGGVVPSGGGFNGPLRFQSQLRISDQEVFREYLKRETRMCDPGIWNWGAASCGTYAQSGYAVLVLNSYQIQYGAPGQLTITGGPNFNYGGLSRQMDVIIRPFSGSSGQGYEIRQVSGWSFISGVITNIDQSWNTVEVAFFYQSRQFATGSMFRY